jgi:hypothetical protein
MLDSGELSLTPVIISFADTGFDKVRFAPLCPENAELCNQRGYGFHGFLLIRW